MNNFSCFWASDLKVVNPSTHDISERKWGVLGVNEEDLMHDSVNKSCEEINDKDDKLHDSEDDKVNNFEDARVEMVDISKILIWVNRVIVVKELISFLEAFPFFIKSSHHLKNSDDILNFGHLLFIN